MNTECKEVERKVQDCNQQLATNLQDQVNWHCAYLLLVTDEHYAMFQPVCYSNLGANSLPHFCSGYRPSVVSWLSGCCLSYYSPKSLNIYQVSTIP